MRQKPVSLGVGRREGEQLYSKKPDDVICMLFPKVSSAGYMSVWQLSCLDNCVTGCLISF